MAKSTQQLSCWISSEIMRSFLAYRTIVGETTVALVEEALTQFVESRVNKLDDEGIKCFRLLIAQIKKHTGEATIGGRGDE